MITPSGTQDDLTVDANGVKKFVFRTTFKDSYQGEVLAAYSYNNLNAKKVVLYYDNASDYAKELRMNSSVNIKVKSLLKLPLLQVTRTISQL